jgi:hypothetical protein
MFNIGTVYVLQVEMSGLTVSDMYTLCEKAKMKMTVFWDIALRSLTEVYQLFTGACYLHHQD